MIIRSTFRILVLLVVLLTFSSHSVFAKEPRPTKPKVERKLSPAEAQAKSQAKQNAGDDLNKPLWIGTGCAAPIFPILGLWVGSLVPQSSSGGGFQILSDEEALGACVGLALGCLGPLVLTSWYQSTPPPERFIGKSPEYIAVYTDVYKTRIRLLRVQYTAAGCAIGYGGLAMIGNILDD